MSLFQRSAHAGAESAEPAVRLIHCSFCGLDFRPEEGRTACSVCPLHVGCRLYRCPRCGMDMLPEPSWAQKVRDWWQAWRRREN